jgi:hypothetical protein
MLFSILELLIISIPIATAKRTISGCIHVG